MFPTGMNSCMRFRTSARAAARTRVCSKDAALFDRKITARVDLISLHILSIMYIKLRLFSLKIRMLEMHCSTMILTT
jgi:hypothetical protein